MATRQKILIIDNDVDVAQQTALYLNNEFYDIMIAADSNTVFKKLRDADLILLDLHSPGMDNLQICRQIRAVTHKPLIILSDKSDVFDRVLSLEMGADDYIVKPFDTRELVARVRALFRRSDPSYYTDYKEPEMPAPKKAADRQNSVEYPDLTINLSNYSVLCDGKRMDMPPKEIELLYFIASSPNQVFTREQLLQNIWGYDYVGDSRTVDVHIKRIREKLKDHAAWAINTVWGVGYRFYVK